MLIHDAIVAHANRIEEEKQLPVLSSTQLTLDFQPGLAERYDSLKACVRGCIHGSERPMKAIAADMDMSQSDLTRKLSGNPGGSAQSVGG